MTISLAPPRPASRSAAGRSYGQATVLQKRPGGLTTADAAAVTAYVPGTTTPYPGPLYGDPDTLTPLVFPVATGADGVVALWADAPGRLELEAVHPVLGRGRVVLDLEPSPLAPAPADAYTKAESDARFVNTDGDTMTGPLTLNDFFALKRLDGAPAYGPAWVTHAGVPRWITAVTGDEAGANTGSDWSLSRVADGGANLGAALAFDRASGAATFGAPVTVVASGGTGSGFVARTDGSTAVARIGQVVGGARFDLTANVSHTAGVWNLDDPAQHGVVVGGNAGVPFSVAFLPAGANPATPRYKTLLSLSGAGALALTPDAGQTGLAISGKAVAASPDASNALEWRANGFYATAGGGGITQGDADLRYLQLTGGTLSGQLAISGAAGTQRILSIQTAGVKRWDLRASASAEGGSNGGSNFEIVRYADNGSAQPTQVTIFRSTGILHSAGEVRTATGFNVNVDTAYLTLGTTAPAAAGALRLRNAATVAWRNAGNTADLALTVNASDQLAFNGTPLGGGLDQAAADLRYLQLATGGAVLGAVTVPSPLTIQDITLIRQAANDLRVNASWMPTTTAARDLGANSLRWRTLFAGDVIASNALSLGTTPAAAGIVRLPNAQAIAWRNAGNTADLTLGADASNSLVFAGGNVGVGAAPKPWSAGFRALQLGTPGAAAVWADGAQGAYVTSNSYHDGTNTRAATGTLPATQLYVGGDFQVTTAPAVAAGAVQSFVQRLVVGATGALTLTPDAGVVALSVANQTTTTAATGGAATALPAQPVGYLTVRINGTDRKLCFYAV
jgi:hypothetical protein